MKKRQFGRGAEHPRLRPYRWLARFYDQLQEDAPARNRYARGKTLGLILSQVRSVCDLGCGTGETALDFSRLRPAPPLAGLSPAESGAGFGGQARRRVKVYAVDLSPELCRITREKARRAKLPVKVLCADMRRFRLLQQVDLVTCEFSVLNHLPRHSDIHRTFRAVAHALRPGGWFLFDVDTRRTFEERYVTTAWAEQKNFKLVLRGRYDKPRRKAFLDFEWFLPAGALAKVGRAKGKLWRHEHECVESIWWTDAEIRRALRRAGFRRIRSWDGVAVRPPSPENRPGFDTYYLAQKENHGFTRMDTDEFG